MVNDKELTSRTIPGITWKQVMAFSAALVFSVSAYIDLRTVARDAYKQGVSNGDLIKVIQEDNNRDQKLIDAKIQAIELQIRECKIRMDIMEKFLEGYNK